MAKAVSITVHPSGLVGEYLTVADAMRQVLDLVGALEGIEASDSSDRQIVWRLTDAHTNSPPFTVKAEAFSRDPQISVRLAANRVSHLYAVAISSVLTGSRPDWLESEPRKALRRALKRNLNGVGHTEVVIDDEAPIVIVPASARLGIEALAEAETQEEDYQRTEYGAVECQVIGLTKWYSSPALIVAERVSGDRAICVLTPRLAAELGPQHQWAEAWEGGSLLIGGSLYYNAQGTLKRIAASFYERVEYTHVSIADLASLDITNGLSVSQHLEEFWGERFA